MKILGQELRKIGIDEDIAAKCDSENFRMMEGDEIFDDARSKGPIQMQLARNLGRVAKVFEKESFGPLKI